MVKPLLCIFFLCFTIRLSSQSHSTETDSICHSLAAFYGEPDAACKYDTLILLHDQAGDSAVIFAVGNKDIHGILTPYVDIYFAKGLLAFRHVLQDTLLNADCAPCDSPRDFLGLQINPFKNRQQVILNCSYFYNRHQMAGEIYRSFVYEISRRPLRVQRNEEEELKYRRTDIGKINTEEE